MSAGFKIWENCKVPFDSRNKKWLRNEPETWKVQGTTVWAN
jgi:hypothetical protein